MTLLISLTVVVIFGVAAYLMLKREGGAPLVPSDEGMSDPLVQALTLTAIVISFGTATLVLALVYRVYDSHHSVDIARIGSEEERQAMLDDQTPQENLGARMGSDDDPEEKAEDERRETAHVTGEARR